MDIQIQMIDGPEKGRIVSVPRLISPYLFPVRPSIEDFLTFEEPDVTSTYMKVHSYVDTDFILTDKYDRIRYYLYKYDGTHNG